MRLIRMKYKPLPPTPSKYLRYWEPFEWEEEKMPRLIDAADAFTVLTAYYHHRTEVMHNSLREALDRVPTVNAVPVVRCKDCKYYEAWKKDGDCYCTRYSADPYEYLPMEDDDFCSRAERSEEWKAQ